VNLTWLNIYGNQISDISSLAEMVNLVYLNLRQNQISDLNPLVELHDIGELDLGYNEITDIYPLVENVYMDPGNLSLRGNPLDATSCNVYVPELEGRGVLVEHDCP
jgi:hypothetical protein